MKKLSFLIEMFVAILFIAVIASAYTWKDMPTFTQYKADRAQAQAAEINGNTTEAVNFYQAAAAGATKDGAIDFAAQQTNRAALMLIKLFIANGSTDTELLNSASELLDSIDIKTLTDETLIKNVKKNKKFCDSNK